jgi:hypothetical protein
MGEEVRNIVEQNLGADQKRKRTNNLAKIEIERLKGGV